jgi:hypothetical protein
MALPLGPLWREQAAVSRKKILNCSKDAIGGAAYDLEGMNIFFGKQTSYRAFGS